MDITFTNFSARHAQGKSQRKLYGPKATILIYDIFKGGILSALTVAVVVVFSLIAIYFSRRVTGISPCGGGRGLTIDGRLAESIHPHKPWAIPHWDLQQLGRSSGV